MAIERRQTCNNHAHIEHLATTNNALTASLAGQMKILLWVLGGCGVVLAGAMTTQVRNTIKTEKVISATISGVSKNRHALERVDLRVSDIEKYMRGDSK